MGEMGSPHMGKKGVLGFFEARLDPLRRAAREVELEGISEGVGGVG